MKLAIVNVTGSRSYPPRVSEFTNEFWKNLGNGVWQSTSCEDCGRQTFPPKAICPHCWSTNVNWKGLGAHGTLYSWTRIHSAPTIFSHEAPYSVGIVDLDCGIRLACRLFNPDSYEFHPDMRMEMIVLQYEDGPLFAARPRA